MRLAGVAGPRTRAIAAFASVVIVAGATSACAEWQAERSRERGVPFGTGQYDGQVVAQSGLNVRAEPTTGSDSRAVLVNGTTLRITCRAQGQTIEGDPGWYKLGFRRWVSARYVETAGEAPPPCD